jgi:hypothetical protein
MEGSVPATMPWIVLVVLPPAWLTALTLERDLYDTDNPLYYRIPNITRDPVALVLNLTITPLINTETDQVMLITVLIVAFGTAVERRFGAGASLGIFWGTSAAGALVGGLLLHLLYPLFPEVAVFESGWNRVFNGASAGGFGLMGAFAATAHRPLVWIKQACLGSKMLVVIIMPSKKPIIGKKIYAIGFHVFKLFFCYLRVIPPIKSLKFRNGFLIQKRPFIRILTVIYPAFRTPRRLIIKIRAIFSPLQTLPKTIHVNFPVCRSVPGRHEINPNLNLFRFPRFSQLGRSAPVSCFLISGRISISSRMFIKPG